MGIPEIVLIIKASILGLVAIFIIFLISAIYAIRIAKEDRITRKILEEQERMNDDKFWEEIDYKS